MANDFVDKAFDMLMSVPTNKLSRSVAFKANYWKKVGELAGSTNKQTLNKLIKQALSLIHISEPTRPY